MSVVELVCPECGTRATTSAGSRAATDFCAVCDYPLFWAKGQVTSAISLADSDTTRRAPGIGGTRDLAPVACPNCRELNDPAAHTCLRCGGLMQLPTPPPAPEPPAPQPVVVRQEVKCNHWPMWVVIVLTACASITLTALAMTFL
ncbi:hypothetical protein SAMN06309944_1496 [Micrococcales bacterium KH10]|nr:hypothetical protein SAMN06309944_1496 [Micrococcales bacterium KH10]